MLPDSSRDVVRTYGPLLVILLFVIGTRLLSVEHYLSGYDPGNYWLALDDYSIKEERPHPPGYPVYVGMLHGAAAITGDRHQAMLALQLVYSMAAVVMLYLLALRWLGVRGATLSTAFLAINPLFWLYGATSENYSWDAFFGVAVVYSMLTARDRWWIAAGVLLGLGAGVRGASIVLMLPVILYIVVTRWRGQEIVLRDLVVAGSGIIAGLLMWLPTTAAKVGGLVELVHDSTGVTTASAGPFIGNLIGLVITFFWMLNLMGGYLILRSGSIYGWIRNKWFDSRRRFYPLLLVLWLCVPLLFFALIIYAKGYGLLILPALCIVAAWLTLREQGTWIQRAVTSTLLLGHALVFLAIPYNSPPAYTALAPRNRTTEERLNSVLGRAVSVYLPSVQRIRASDDQVAESLTLIGKAVGEGGDTTSVVLDPSIGVFTGPRILQVYMPRVTFIVPGIRAARLISYHHGIDKDERYGDTASLKAPRLLLLTDRGLAERYEGLQGKQLGSGDYFTLLEIPVREHAALRSRLEELFVRW